MGPLHGVRIVEIASIGPGPFAAMMLADMGADVIRLERPGGDPLGSGSWHAVGRGRPSVTCDLKTPQGRERVLDLAQRADALIEGFRPGVMERLQLGPDVVLARNPQLVYGRMTGYGQQGPLSQVAGHDINYLALAGVLEGMRRPGQRPVFPINLLGDYGGGGMLLAFGVVCGILEARWSGQGQVIDAAMVDGVALLSTLIHAARGAGLWNDEPGTNIGDGGAPYYDVYETSDGRFVAVGAIEPQFYAELLRLIDLDPDLYPQNDSSCWDDLRAAMTARFAQRTRDEWSAVLEQAPACGSAVYSWAEAPAQPHNVARNTFVRIDGVVQPAPAPRFSRTPASTPAAPSEPGADTASALQRWGL